MMDVVKVEVHVLGGEWCECGGLMEVESEGYMSCPPKSKLECPFCGETKFVVSPYSPKIGFKQGEE